MSFIDWDRNPSDEIGDQARRYFGPPQPSDLYKVLARMLGGADKLPPEFRAPDALPGVLYTGTSQSPASPDPRATAAIAPLLAAYRAVTAIPDAPDISTWDPEGTVRMRALLQQQMPQQGIALGDSNPIGAASLFRPSASAVSNSYGPSDFAGPIGSADHLSALKDLFDTLVTKSGADTFWGQQPETDPNETPNVGPFGDLGHGDGTAHSASTLQPPSIDSAYSIATPQQMIDNDFISATADPQRNSDEVLRSSPSALRRTSQTIGA